MATTANLHQWELRRRVINIFLEKIFDFFILLRSALAQGTSTLAQSNGPHTDSATNVDVKNTIEVAAWKLNIFNTLEIETKTHKLNNKFCSINSHCK